MDEISLMKIDVSETATKVIGLDPLQLNDLVQDAPEPPPPGFGGLRSTPANLLYLFARFPDADWHDPHGKLVEARAHRLIEALRQEEPGDYERNWPFRKAPWPFQLRIFTAARKMKYIALAPVVMGSGKTKMLLDIAADKFMHDEIDCVVVVAAPKGVHRQWVDDAIPTHMTSAIKYRAAVWSSTRKTPDAIAYKEAARKYIRILTFNVEAFSGDSGKAAKALKAFMATGRCFLIEDESSRIKTPRAARTKALLKLAPLAACRAISSGTPITKGLEDLWSQYEFLDPSILGMSNYFAFRHRYCVTAPAFRGAGLGAVKITGYRNVEEFVRKIAPHTFVVPKSALGLPEKRREPVPVEVTPEQRKIYNALRRHLIEDLALHRIASPANAAVRLVRLQQVLCGRVYEKSDEDEPLVCRTIPSNRLAALKEFLEDHAGPTVIWARFVADIQDIARLLGPRCVTYYGATSDKDRERDKKLFRDGEVPYFVGNPAVGGMGVDGLQEAAEQTVYYSSSFNREHRWQSEDRTDRIGKKSMTTSSLYVDLIVPNSVDTMILASYEKTEDLVRSVMSRPEMIPTLNED